MARRTTRTRGSGGGGAAVRISVGLDHDTWLRLKALALVRECAASDLVAGLIQKAVEGVRLPTAGGGDAAA